MHVCPYNNEMHLHMHVRPYMEIVRTGPLLPIYAQVGNNGTSPPHQAGHILSVNMRHPFGATGMLTMPQATFPLLGDVH